MKYKIYKRVIDNQIIYIGYTTLTLKQRQCKNNGKLTEILKNASMELIEETDDKSREEFWRNYFESMGCVLLNKQRGVSGLSPYEQTKMFRKDALEKYYENNKEARREYGKRNYQKNKEKILERHKKNYEKKREIMKEKFKEYYQKRKIEKKPNIENSK